MSQLITGIHHVAIYYNGIEKLQEGIRFYNEILGLPIARTWGEGIDQGAMIDTGAGLLELFAKGNGESDNTICHIALACNDVDTAVERCVAAGYKVKMEPKEICIGSVPPLPARIAFVYGAGGEEIEFFNEK